MTQGQQTVWIDGSTGEGGGQILRASVALSALTGKTVEIANIRARRSRPGLQAQHLTSVRAAASLCDATLHGDELGSSHLKMVPGALRAAGAFHINIADARGGASAGATGLVGQTMLLPMAFLPGGDSSSVILGGTHVPMAPTADYLACVYAPILRRMGIEADCAIAKAGFYPKGGGEITLTVRGGIPATPLGLTERGRLRKLRVLITTALLPEHVATRGRETALKGLKGYGVEVETTRHDLPSHGPGAAVVIVAECENGIGGWTGLGERGKPMERVAEEAVRGFVKWFGANAAVDAHLADQLALPCALVPQRSQWTAPEATEHLRTVLWLTQQFLPIEYSLEESENGCRVTLRGVSLPNRI